MYKSECVSQPHQIHCDHQTPLYFYSPLIIFYSPHIPINFPQTRPLIYAVANWLNNTHVFVMLEETHVVTEGRCKVQIDSMEGQYWTRVTGSLKAAALLFWGSSTQDDAYRKFKAILDAQCWIDSFTIHNSLHWLLQEKCCWNLIDAVGLVSTYGWFTYCCYLTSDTWKESKVW